jgi:hypothetical protein
VQSEYTLTDPVEGGNARSKLCSKRCTASNPRSSPQNEFAMTDFSAKDSESLPLPWEHSRIIAVEQTSEWRCSMYDPSDTQIGERSCLAW